MGTMLASANALELVLQSTTRNTARARGHRNGVVLQSTGPSTLSEFFATPQGKLLKRIGRSSVEWMGGAWNERLSEICMRAAEETHTTFDADETRVLTEMYERIRTKDHAPRSKEEIEAIMAFWWKLQQWRRRFLERNHRFDTAEDRDMWWELTKRQQKSGHLPSIYNAVLNNRSGWATVANAIIKYRMPQLPHLRKSDSVTKHIQIIERFCCDLLQWMKKFAGAAVAYWRTAEYEKARKSSALRKNSSRCRSVTILALGQSL